MTAITVSKASSRAERISAAEWLVWLTVLLMLGAGWFLRDRIEGRTETFQQDGVTLQYPADWSLLADEEDFHIFHVIDPTSSVQFPTTVRVRRIPLGELGRGASSLGDVALSWSTLPGPEDSHLQRAANPADDRGAPTRDRGRLRSCGRAGDGRRGRQRPGGGARTGYPAAERRYHHCCDFRGQHRHVSSRNRSNGRRSWHRST